MKNSKLLYLIIGLLTCIFLSSNAFAIGFDSPGYWKGDGSKVFDFNTYPPGGQTYAVPPFTIVQDITTIANKPTSASYSELNGNTTYPNGYVTAWSQSDYYKYHGSIYASGYPQAWETGGFTRDELYFQTYNGLPGQIEMVFNVDVSGATYTNSGGDTPNAYLAFAWSVYDPSTGIFVEPLADTQLILNITGANSGTQSFSGTVDYKSYDIDSGKYVPFSLGAWGAVKDGWLNWGDTIQLVGVNAYEGNVQLQNDQFTLYSDNGITNFAPFTHQMETNAVPEPTTMLLLGSGLLGLVGLRRKFKK